jgi:hypothetical protein
MHLALKSLVILSFLVCIGSLCILIWRTLSLEKRPFYSKPTASGKAGILYAFGRGMMPWEKESAGRHLLTYLAGIIYHISIFLALFYLLLLLIAISIPFPLMLVLRALLLIGALAGLGLLVKRMSSPLMRSISSADDFASNILVSLFLLASLITSFAEEFKVILFLVSIILFLYIPISKIQHCFFFFYTRILFGLFYGRRGALPPNRKRART